ncbi:MAG: Gfo/Idh/MocA family oxidoreductase [Spirochaetales bacterium]|nr:Gfo/Idh/MocA family oxidoreductase [Spirochaetales bacterium]
MRKAVVIGLGIGMAHAAGYMESPDADLHGVCDLIPERTSRMGGTFESGSMLCLKPLFTKNQLAGKWEKAGVKVYPDMASVLSDPEVDIVSICTPDYLHLNHLKLAMKAGKDILLEKPVGIDIMAAEALSAEVSAYPGALGIGYEFRLNPAILKMRELVLSGEVGPIEGFSLYHFRTPFRRDKWNSWIQKREYSGGLIIEETCHWFDLARYITGKEVESLHCLTTGGVHQDFDFEDIAYINGTFKERGILQISHSLTGFDFSLQLCLHGQKGTVWCGLKEENYSSLDGGASDHIGIVSFGKPGMSPADARIWKWGKEATEPQNIRDLVKEFAARSAQNVPQRASWEDGCQSLRLSVKALESARLGKIVKT